MKVVEIEGGTALVREPENLRGRDKNLVMAASVAAESALRKMPEEATAPKGKDETDEDYAQRVLKATEGISYTRAETMSLMELREASVVATLESWDLKDDDGKPLPLPTVDTIGDLPSALYDSLIESVAGVPGTVMSGMNFDPQPGKANPTGGSSSSALPSSTEAESPSTPSSLSDGTPTNGESSSPEQ